MRALITIDKIEKFFTEVAKSATSPGKIYLVGGSTALILGFRNQTVDIDIKIDPEPGGVFQRFVTLKDELDISIELASPDQFLPPLPNWRGRSIFIKKIGEVEFYHFDFYSQTLAKIERGLRTDMEDAKNFVLGGYVNTSILIDLFGQIRDQIVRYPSIDLSSLEKKLHDFITSLK